ncbi:MAG TPA: hypothetical protein VEH06_07010 [Candidatus Bathyarchaeia archaeon]|nr:hypothetical protein [Candidatus Bathyarchaeia archaeon]
MRDRQHPRSIPTTITTPTEPIEVSYTILGNVAKDPSASLQKIATAINVQLKLGNTQGFGTENNR